MSFILQKIGLGLILCSTITEAANLTITNNSRCTFSHIATHKHKVELSTPETIESNSTAHGAYLFDLGVFSGTQQSASAHYLVQCDERLYPLRLDFYMGKDHNGDMNYFFSSAYDESAPILLVPYDKIVLNLGEILQISIFDSEIQNATEGSPCENELDSATSDNDNPNPSTRDPSDRRDDNDTEQQQL